eukprot:SAG11_NODE_3163_length_2641_cov_8.683714_4_plen_109_part_00
MLDDMSCSRGSQQPATPDTRLAACIFKVGAAAPQAQLGCQHLAAAAAASAHADLVDPADLGSARANCSLIEEAAAVELPPDSLRDSTEKLHCGTAAVLRRYDLQLQLQ